jgi:nucleoid DNA-binding protein
MKNKTKKAGKNVLIEEIMAKGLGLSSRKATRAVNTVVDRIKFALWCGEPVEIPGGTIQAKIRKGKPRQEKMHKFKNVQTRKAMYKAVKYPGRRRVVTFTPDKTLDLTPPPLPPPPETSEQIEARQLATELLALKEPADTATMTTLQQAAEFHSNKPGALLRRLREFKTRGWQFHDVYSLATRVTAHYWL